MKNEILNLNDEQLVAVWNVLQWQKNGGIERNEQQAVASEMARRGIPHKAGKRTIGVAERHQKQIAKQNKIMPTAIRNMM